MLRDAIAWALAQIAAEPDVTARAATAIGRCLDVLDASAWPEVASRFSGLNADGCPLELAFSSRDHAVRFTSEAAPPEVAERDRLARAESLMVAIGGSAMPAVLRAQLAALHAGAERLAWGAAIAGRHDATGDRYKLYVEVPAAPRVPIAPALDDCFRRALLVRAPRVVMLGWDAGADRVEHYTRSDGLVPGELARILDACRLGDRTRELEHAVSLTWGGSAGRALEAQWGLSFAGPRDGNAVVAVSLFKEANRMLGGDARARTRLLGLVEALDAGALDAYARVTEPLAHVDGTGAHGMLALTVAIDQPLELRIGVSPLAAFRARI